MSKEKLIDAFRTEDDGESFTKKYNEFRKKAYENPNLYKTFAADFAGEFRKNKKESDSGRENWKKAYELAWTLVFSFNAQTGGEIRKKEILSNIISILQENMSMFSAFDADRLIALNVCIDIMETYGGSDEEHFYYPAAVYNILQQIEGDPECKAFYGDEAKEQVVKRTREFFRVTKRDWKKLYRESEKPEDGYKNEFLKALWTAEPERTAARSEKNRKRRKDRVKKLLLQGLEIIVLIVSLVLAFMIGQMVEKYKIQQEIKDNKEQAEESLEQYERLQEKLDKIEAENENLDSENKKLKEQASENSNQEADTNESQNTNRIVVNSGDQEEDTKIVLQEQKNFRQEMNTEDAENIIDSLPAGTEVTLLQEEKYGWKKIEYEGRVGYIKYEVDQ